MGHYSAEMWLQYIEGNIDTSQARTMEDHLAQCDTCLKLYALAAECSVDQEVSPQFTQKVMAHVTSGKGIWLSKNARPMIPRTAQGTRKPRQALGNYAVAACLTLLLTAGGIFGNVAAALPAVTGSEMSLADTAAEKVSFGWSEAIAEKAISVLDIFKPD